MPRKLLQRYLPKREILGQYQLTQRFAPFLNRIELWSVKRNLIASGLALGLFCGMIPGPLQMLAAISFAILLRVNLPAAVLGTCFSNPFTIVPLYMLAYTLGLWCLGDAGARDLPSFPASDWQHPQQLWSDWSEWLLASGQPLLIGILLLAVLLALAGYILVQVSWRLNVLHALRRRRYNRLQLARGD